MGARPALRMTAAEFLTWAGEAPGRERFELVDGAPIAMAPERNRHALVKMDVAQALDTALREAGLGCTVFPDGASVVIDATTVYEPDVTLTCADVIDLDAPAVPDPLLVVEVISPASRSIDTGRKLVDYFRLPSLTHDLVVDSAGRTVTHHRRAADGVTTRIGADVVDLDPPGIRVATAPWFRRVTDR